MLNILSIIMIILMKNVIFYRKLYVKNTVNNINNMLKF